MVRWCRNSLRQLKVSICLFSLLKFSSCRESNNTLNKQGTWVVQSSGRTKFMAHTFGFYLWLAVRLPSQSAYCRIVGTMLELEHTTLSTQCAWSLMLLHIPQSIDTKLYKIVKLAVQNAPFIYTVSPLYTSQNRQKSTLACTQQNLTGCSGTFSILHLYYLLGHTKYFFWNWNSRVVWALDCRLNLLWQCIPGNIHAPFMLHLRYCLYITSSVLCGSITKGLALNYFLIHTYEPLTPCVVINTLFDLNAQLLRLYFPCHAPKCESKWVRWLN